MALWKIKPLLKDRAHGPVLFLDRDGVVVMEKDYLRNQDEVELVAGAAAAIAAARDAGFLIVGVSNQSGLGRGLFGPGEFESVMVRLDELLAAAGASFDAFFYCPHAPSDGCSCRKPGPGMLEEAVRHFSWSDQDSWVVGDKASDILFGRQAGLGAVLVRTGYGVGQEMEVSKKWGEDGRVFVADDLSDAVRMILDGKPGKRIP